MKALEGKVALVTGGARGIGKAVILKLAQQGCDITVSDIDLQGIERVKEEVEALGSGCIAVKADISNPDEVKKTVESTIERFKKIDILVNNAGITRDNLLMRMKEEDWDLVLRVNLKGAFLCTQKVIRGMMKQRSGKIINMASVVGLVGNAGQVNYAASKAGLIGFTKSVAKEVASRNIQVNAVAPGYIETEMTAHLPQDVRENFISNIPAQRSGTPGDVANVVLFLSSTASDYITGQVICVDGGLVIS
ncbi:3-oxoacyl-[acyl-carrier-protein] reductase [bacterium]|nr:3-oxoacyl-[acyl-carrier-protein] reductase [bacterium]